MIMLAGTMASFCFGQSAQNSFAASISNGDRLTLAQTSIDIPTWHEKTFWPVYEEYLHSSAEVSSETFRVLDRFVKTEKQTAGEEAYQNAKEVLETRIQEFAILKQFYASIAREFNGYIAMQFVQTEIMLDMVESANVYDNSQWRKFRFHPKAMSMDQIAVAKRNTINNALGLKGDDLDNFWSVYAEYEEECEATLGENYDMISSYAGDVSDFTPALSKRLGSDLLLLMDRELKLKVKYFEAMNEKAGPQIAANFLAWEDYYSLVSKMYSWAEE